MIFNSVIFTLKMEILFKIDQFQLSLTNEKNWDKNEEGGEKIVYVINHLIFRSFSEIWVGCHFTWNFNALFLKKIASIRLERKAFKSKEN